MTDDKQKRVSQFPGRRGEISRAVASVIANQPAVGGSQGDFKRDPCGTCLSWRRDQRAGTNNVPLTAGMCMFGPPTPHPIMTDTGQMVSVMFIRPPMQSDNEGCDQHDDGTDDDGTDGGGEPAALLEKVG